MGTGEQFVKWIKPAGCVLFLGLFILVTITLFASEGQPVSGYKAPHDSSYYAENLEELREEIDTNLFPKLKNASAELLVGDGIITVTAPEDCYHLVRNSIIHYYDKELFEFIKE